MEEFKTTLRADIQESLRSPQRPEAVGEEDDDDSDNISEHDLMEIFLVRIARLEEQVRVLEAWKAKVIESYAST